MNLHDIFGQMCGDFIAPSAFWELHAQYPTWPINNATVNQLTTVQHFIWERAAMGLTGGAVIWKIFQHFYE